MATEIFPVVHINSIKQAVEQAGVALDLGADGVYLIDHMSGHSDKLLQALRRTSAEYPDGFVGVNFLNHSNALDAFDDLRTAKAVEIISSYPDGLWVDDASRADFETLALREQYPELKTIRYLGGVAFKYTVRYTDNPDIAVLEAKQFSGFVDVVTTSGPGTGRPPRPEKIAAMKRAIGGQPLAVASGVDIDNLPDYGGNIDQLLVASSIETVKGSGIFDEAKLRDLIQLAHKL